MLSTYAEKLPDQAKQRYKDKTRLIGCVDPFLLPIESCDGVATPANLPPVEASDIVAYLVLQTSFLTTKQFKAYKSLESYNQFINGWVKDVKAWKVQDNVVVTGRVSHLCTHCYNNIYIIF